MGKGLKINLILILAVLTLCFKAGAAAESPEAFYKGKTVIITVGSSPGGGYDTWARLVAKSLEKMLRATVIVKNIPEAGGVVALDDIYHTRGAGGLKIHLARDILPPLLQATNFPGTSARWDVNKLMWLARLSTDPAVFASSPKKFRNFAEVKKAKEFLCGVDAAMSVSGTRTAIAFEALGLTNAKIVAGYPGGTERRLAVIQGELGGTSGSYDSLEKYFASGDLVPLWVVSKERLKENPQIPTVYDLGVKQEARKWLDWELEVEQTGRTLVAPPDTPQDRVKFLRETLAKMVRDQDFLRNVAKYKYSVQYLSGEKLQDIFKKVMAITEKEKEELIYILKVKYMK